MDADIKPCPIPVLQAIDVATNIVVRHRGTVRKNELYRAVPISWLQVIPAEPRHSLDQQTGEIAI